ncbi:MAG: iron-sulfur cluster repair di-iron protein [Bacteroidia bacterium]|nr:iron-sulfur cluster repair di-iron protein [Bacteroidia bacterium]MCZ2248071.1 iron-sulfur cluster repair di-iron protein [Bacteroidia bacterium]
MEISVNSIIGEVVAKDYRAASVFKQYNIDFCCNGNRSIKDACLDKNINASEIIGKLNDTISANGQGSNVDYTSCPLDLLADYVEKKHHRYTESKISEIKPYLNKIVKVHGANHPELAQIEQLFLESAGELAKHMKKEELILFPFIRKMAESKHSGRVLNPPHFGTVNNPIETMFKEHDQEGERFRKIAELSNNYTPPADACNTYRITFALLNEFEEDLNLHIHLENNILFPKAIELEKQALQQAV